MKIFLFSRDPGGANTIIPLVGPLKERGYEAILYGKDVALERYEKFGLEGKDISSELNSINERNIEEFLHNLMPDFIITGTSADDWTEKYIWAAASRLHIPSFAIIDQWVNYGIRFSNYGVADLCKYENDRRHVLLPDKILVMDEDAKNEMINEGFDAERIFVSGQPYFELMDKYINNITEDKVAGLRERLKCSHNEFMIVFASEDITKSYKEKDDGFYLGYTERTIFVELAESLVKLGNMTNKKIKLVVRPHPKEDPLGIDDLIDKYRRLDIDIIIDKNEDAWTVMKSAELICGMSSMFLIEACILGRPVLSIQIGLKRENPFILDRKGLVKSITKSCDLYDAMSNILVHGKLPQCRYNAYENSVNKIINQMEEYLCGN